MAASFDSVHSATGVSSPADADGDHTFAITVPGTANLVIIPVGIGIGADGGLSVTSVTVNGVSATKLGTSIHENASTAGFIDLWYLLNPTTGNVVITSNANGADIGTNAVYYAGAGTPTGFVSATGNGTNLSVSISAATDSVAANFMGQGHMDFVSGTYNRTKRFGLDVNNNTAGGNIGYQDMVGTGGSNAMTMTPAVTDWWASIAFEIPAGGAGPDPGYGYLMQEVAASRFTLEDASGFLLLDTASAAPIPPMIVLPPRSL